MIMTDNPIKAEGPSKSNNPNIPKNLSIYRIPIIIVSGLSINGRCRSTKKLMIRFQNLTFLFPQHQPTLEIQFSLLMHKNHHPHPVPKTLKK